MSDTITILFDTKLRQPACVLLQAVAGCSAANGFIQMHFDPHTWLTSPTPDMHRVTGSREDWTRIAQKLRTKRLPGVKRT